MKKRRFISALLPVLAVVALAAVGLCSCGVRISRADSIICGREIFFVDDKNKEEWREPLEALLSNVLVPYGEGGEILGYKAMVDPDAPAVYDYYACGLFDLTGDGVPELLVCPIGDTSMSGASSYYVYDIYSGEELGYVGSNLAYYYSIVDDSLKIEKQDRLRGGFYWLGSYVYDVRYDEQTGKYGEIRRLYESHSLDMVEIEREDGSREWVEIYTDSAYYVYDDQVSLDEYIRAQDEFFNNYIRISETDFVSVVADQVCDRGDNNFVKAAKMADALISSGQEFIGRVK